MEFWQVLWLSLLQGVTEFLPISSSAHLILPSALLGWQDQGLIFDVAVHLGSLLAVALYFRKKLFVLVTSLFQQGVGYQSDSQKLLVHLALATLPVVIAGGLGHTLVEQYLRSPWVIAATTVSFGLLLWLADGKRGQLGLAELTWKMALIIGCAQALALIPGTSRSGITMTAALLLGCSRQAGSEFSFLLSIPVILMASMLMILKIFSQEVGVDWVVLISAAAIAFVSAYACIHLFLKAIEALGFLPFVIYRLLLGVVIVAVIV